MVAETILLQGARVLCTDADPDLPPTADVVIRDGLIHAVGPPDTVGAEVGGARRVDLNGHLLMPGFVNAHYHSFDTLAKGCFETMPLDRWGLVALPAAFGATLDEIRVRTLLGAVECLRNGITTVQDFCILAPLADEHLDAILDAYAEAGLRAIFSISLRDRSQLETTYQAQEVVPAQMRAVFGDTALDAQSQLAFVERQIERIGDRDGMVVWALSPVAPQRCSAPLLTQVAKLAERQGLPIYTHVYETRGQRLHAQDAYASFGGSLIAFMETVGLLGPRTNIAHGIWPDLAEIEILARTGTGVVLNMLSNLRLRSGIPPIQAYRRLGIPLALGCDNCSCSDVQSMFQVMKLYCLLAGNMDATDGPEAAEALHLATAGGARSARQDHALGTIAPGMKADLIALDLSDPAYRPLNSAVRQIVYAETGRSIRHVWVDGRHVVRDGRCTTVDEAQLATQLDTVMPGFRARLERRRADVVPLAPAMAEIERRTWTGALGHRRYLDPN